MVSGLFYNYFYYLFSGRQQLINHNLSCIANIFENIVVNFLLAVDFIFEQEHHTRPVEMNRQKKYLVLKMNTLIQTKFSLLSQNTTKVMPKHIVGYVLACANFVLVRTTRVPGVF